MWEAKPDLIDKKESNSRRLQPLNLPLKPSTEHEIVYNIFHKSIVAKFLIDDGNSVQTLTALIRNRYKLLI